MDKDKVKEIVVEHIKKHYPEYADIEPEVEEEVVEIEEGTFMKAGMMPVPPKKLYIAVFKKEIKTEDGGKIKSILRTTLDEDGKIIKISHSK